MSYIAKTAIFAKHAAEKLVEISEKPLFKSVNTAVNQQCELIAKFIDRSPLIKLLDERFTNPVALFASKMIVINFKGLVEVSNMNEQIPPTIPISAKHYTAITLFNINSIVLIGTVALRIFIGFTPTSIIWMSTTLIWNRVLGKIVNDRSGAELTQKDLQPKPEVNSVLDQSLNFLEEKLNEAKDTLTKLILQPYMDGGERVLGVFRSYPLNDLNNLLKK